MTFKTVLDSVKPKPDSLCIIWLGQAGFLIKPPNGKIIVIDPYLTDYVYRLFQKEHGYGFKRMTAPVFRPGDIEIDYLFSSHEHGDHLDVDAIVKLLANNRTVLFANKDSMKISAEAGVPLDKIRIIRKGMTIDFDDFKLIVTPADHGDLSPDAMGFIFDFGFARVYFSGDTAYNKEALAQAIDIRPEIALLPINGAFGNLNSEEAAMLANDMSSKVCLPHHFWTFPLHKGEKGDPLDAIELFPKYAPDCRLVMLYPGEPYIYTKPEE